MGVEMDIAVKICGIRTEEALEAAIASGAQFFGLVFFERSPRHVDIATAIRLTSLARGRIQAVTLFVNPDDDELARVIGHVQPGYIQLHGKETPERVHDIRQRFGKPILKAVSVGAESDVRAASAYDGIVEHILFDAKPDPALTALPGGTGMQFDWTLLAPWKGSGNFILSGGLNADNVRAAIALTGAQIVDVSSGVETAPGVKSPELIRAFVAAAQSADARAA